MTIHDRLFEERRRLGLSQSEMATSAGVGFSTYQTYEKSDRFPNAETLEKLYLAGVDVLYVVTGVRNNTTLSNRELVLLEEFKRLDERMQKATISLVQTYNSEV